MQRFIQDIDSRGSVSSLPQHGKRLERSEETANLSAGTTRMVSASYSAGDASSSRNHQWLSNSGRHRSVAAGGMVTRSAAKTGHWFQGFELELAFSFLPSSYLCCRH